MKKFIKVCALLSVVFAFGTIAASAQINDAAKVNIPFSFNVNDKTYEAGEFTVKLHKSTYGAATLTIQRTGSNDLQTILLRDNSGGSGEELQLIFDDSNGAKYLSGITTASSSYSCLPSNKPAATTITYVKKNERKSKM